MGMTSKTHAACWTWILNDFISRCNIWKEEHAGKSRRRGVLRLLARHYISQVLPISSLSGKVTRVIVYTHMYTSFSGIAREFWLQFSQYDTILSAEHRAVDNLRSVAWQWEGCLSLVGNPWLNTDKIKISLARARLWWNKVCECVKR